jgi:translation elongation factor EF-Tu-like GTPase
MHVDDVFHIKGQGVALIGPIKSGGVKSGRRVEVYREGRTASTAIALVEDNVAWDRPGDQFRLLLTDLDCPGYQRGAYQVGLQFRPLT